MRMSKMIMGFAAMAMLCTASVAAAHDMWVNAYPPVKGVMKAELGYGHDFPAPEAIAQDRVHIFAPLELVTATGKVTMTPTGKDTFTYESKVGSLKGGALVLGTYKPTYWSKGTDGTWTQTNRKQRPDAVSVEYCEMFGKHVLNSKDAGDVVTKPVGQRLEIVPLANPATIKVGEKFPVQVLLEGKPLKSTVLNATVEGFSEHHVASAFSCRTDLQGKVDIIPLKAGYWFAKVSYQGESDDKSTYDSLLLMSTLAFSINK